MSLSSTLSDITSKAPAPRNRVDILLDKLEGEDLETLQAALRNPSVSSASLTKAIRIEYHDLDVVKDSCVDRWRRKHLTDVDGL